MPTLEVIKAWKDEEYRDTLTLEPRDQIPAHPSGAIEFEESDSREDNRFKVLGLNTFLCITHRCHTVKNNCTR